MNIMPAIDLYGGGCVRLTQGDYTQMTSYPINPIEMAKKLEEQGADILHVVDLEGAKVGKLVHLDIIADIAKSVKIPVEVGGGIRNEASIQELLEKGIRRIILGTSVLTNDIFAREVLQSYQDVVIFGIDARGDQISVKGWTEQAGRTVIETIQYFQNLGLREVIYTDIDRDGLLQGPNFEMLTNILRHTQVDLIASGGVSNLHDVKQLCSMNEPKLKGFIVGKALYEGTVAMSGMRGICDGIT